MKKWWNEIQVQSIHPAPIEHFNPISFWFVNEYAQKPIEIRNATKEVYVYCYGKDRMGSVK